MLSVIHGLSGIIFVYYLFFEQICRGQKYAFRLLVSTAHPPAYHRLIDQPSTIAQQSVTQRNIMFKRSNFCPNSQSLNPYKPTIYPKPTTPSPFPTTTFYQTHHSYDFLHYHLPYPFIGGNIDLSKSQKQLSIDLLF